MDLLEHLHYLRRLHLSRHLIPGNDGRDRIYLEADERHLIVSRRLVDVHIERFAPLSEPLELKSILQRHNRFRILAVAHIRNDYLVLKLDPDEGCVQVIEALHDDILELVHAVCRVPEVSLLLLQVHQVPVLVLIFLRVVDEVVAPEVLYRPHSVELAQLEGVATQQHRADDALPSVEHAALALVLQEKIAGGEERVLLHYGAQVEGLLDVHSRLGNSVEADWPAVPSQSEDSLGLGLACSEWLVLDMMNAVSFRVEIQRVRLESLRCGHVQVVRPGR